ncbi:MAG: haloacid dehalogenase, family protein [Verrucomicrobiaceae bacterium]|nr:haloacid dehalogenase, family protein [Verrucomicrobiaceae bacterium]
MAVKTVFFDAAGTLIHLRQPVGEAYAAIALEHGLALEAAAMDHAFRSAWKRLPAPVHLGVPEDDDRFWWRQLVADSFAQVLGRTLSSAELEPVFAQLYDHFADPETWLVFDDVRPTLEALLGRCRMFVLSNFDKRLRRVLAGHNLDCYFDGMIISSEVGASKPHPRIFEAALTMAKATPAECLHIGDDLNADIGGAQAAGMATFQVKRPARGLGDVSELLMP